ncbi:MAG: hypothetical protein ABW003_08660 [Microvirga sp.]
MTQHKAAAMAGGVDHAEADQAAPDQPATSGLDREVRSIKISRLASELAVSDEQVGRLMNELQDLLALARSDGLSNEAILWVLEDAVASLKEKLSQESEGRDKGPPGF